MCCVNRFRYVEADIMLVAFLTIILPTVLSSTSARISYNPNCVIDFTPSIHPTIGSPLITIMAFFQASHYPSTSNAIVVMFLSLGAENESVIQWI